MTMQLEWRNNELVQREGSSEPDHVLISSDDARFAPQSFNDIKVIALDFPAMKDGRAFTQARLLRDRGFEGDIRATGSLIRDQLQFAIRCGFTSFDLNTDEPIEALNESASRFDAYYQSAQEGGPSWQSKR